MNSRVLHSVTVLLLLTACSGSKKAFKQAQEYEQAGLYVQAVEADLKALREKPDFTEALSHLKQVAPKAFDELMQRIDNYEAAENWPAAVREYEGTLNLVERLGHHGVVLPTGNIPERLRSAKTKAAASFFAEAESLFVQERWAEAADRYLRAHDFVPQYNGAFEKAIEAFLAAGDHALRRKDYAQALNMFTNVLEISPRHPKAQTGIAETHYRAGRDAFREGQFREALAAFERSDKMVPGYKDAAEWATRAYDQAVQYVGVFPFENESDLPADGYFIASEILGHAVAANLKFVEFLSEARTTALVNQLLRKGRNRFLEVELLVLAKKEGLDSVVWGKIRRVRVREQPESFEEYEYGKTVVVTDTSGKEVEEITPIYYREYTRGRKVSLDVEYFVLDTQTRQMLDKQRFRDDIVDQARWIAYQGSIYDLPEDKRHYLDAPRDPRPPEALIDELLALTARKISRQVTRV
ncbi:tetratricopeptide repeat protein, partial [bacterium]|nr:tetratricopeptide repeat protein [bacterium]